MNIHRDTIYKTKGNVMNRNTRIPHNATNRLASLMFVAILTLGAPLATYAAQGANAESALWEEVKKGNSADDYQVYLTEYPKGKFVALAKSRIKKLQTEQTARDEDAYWKQALDTATRAAMQGYLAQYPHGRYVKQARLKEEEYLRVPSRPQLPFAVSEDIWKTIEASEAYRNTPRLRTFKLSSQFSSQTEFTGRKSSSLPRPAAVSANMSREVTSLGDKCSVLRTNTRQSGADYVSDNYICGGFLSLGSTINGQLAGFIKSIDELKGRLFPMRVGNQMLLRYQSAFVSNRNFDSTITSSCQVISREPASEVNPRLTGNAWKIHCQGSYTSNNDNKTISTETDDYYLEDIGLKVSSLGQLNLQEKKFVLPQPGYQTFIIAEGDYGSRTTTTYTSYDWSVGDEGQESGTAKPGMQPAAADGAGKNWGLTDQDLSVMIGMDIMNKVHMSERRADILAAAQNGDKLSQYLIGASYEYGVGIAKDDVQKVVWHTKSAEQGLTRARTALAIDRIRGSGTEQDDISGWSLLLESSNAGNAVAQYNAAIMTLVGLDDGNGMTRQFHFMKKTDALVLLKRSAEAGVSAAQYSLGHSYLVGTEEHGKDLKQARYWLEKAAAQNLPQAMADLATMP